MVETKDGAFICSDVQWCMKVRAGEADLATHDQLVPRQYYPDPSRRVRAQSALPAELPPIPPAGATAPGQDWSLKVDNLGMIYRDATNERSVIGAEEISFDVAPGGHWASSANPAPANPP